MKQFLIKITICLLIFFTGFIVLSYILITYNPRFSSTLFFKQDWLKINERIEASKNEIIQDTIYVGGSVAGQILPFNNQNQLISNGSIYPIGNYFLIKNAIERNDNIKCVIYYTVPDVIGHRISRERTYNYFVKPFYTFENKNEIMRSEKVRKALIKNKSLELNLFTPYKILSIGDFNYNDSDEQFLYSLSDEALEWLVKIDSLCKSNSVQFHLASPPVPLSKREKSHDWFKIKNKISGTVLEVAFQKYFSSIIYLDDKYLKDHIHWEDSFIKDKKQNFIKFMNESL